MIEGLILEKHKASLGRNGKKSVINLNFGNHRKQLKKWQKERKDQEMVLQEVEKMEKAKEKEKKEKQKQQKQKEKQKEEEDIQVEDAAESLSAKQVSSRTIYVT